MQQKYLLGYALCNKNVGAMVPLHPLQKIPVAPILTWSTDPFHHKVLVYLRTLFMDWDSGQNFCVSVRRLLLGYVAVKASDSGHNPPRS